MHLEKILTKDYLEKNLVQDRMPIMQLALKAGCSKHMIIKYCKKHEIYEEVKRRSKYKPTRLDLTGKVFGALKVIEMGTSDAFNKTRWICECSCGKRKLVNSASLKRGLTKTCGFCADRHNFKGHEEISGSYWRRVIRSAEVRSLDFKITPEYIWDLYIKQNKKCSLSGVDIKFHKNQDKGSLQTVSIDRINSKLGYLEGNVQLVHKRVQRIKDLVPNDEFLFWCKLIYLNNKSFVKNLEIDISNILYHDK
jgi:uncharacterized protein (DUF983 family)